MTDGFGVVAEQIRAHARNVEALQERFAAVKAASGHIAQKVQPLHSGADSEDGQFVVEFREGGPDRHYTAGPQPRDVVVDAFLDYLINGNRWRTAFEWRRLELP